MPAEALRHVRLRVPEAVPIGERAVLQCLFDLQGDALYSVKWYKGRREFYRFTPREAPSVKVFPIPDLKIEKRNSNATQVSLIAIGTTLSGRYSCEVSADAPSFHTALVSADMVVAVVPQTLPELSGVRPRYRVGDKLQGVCTSRRSKPAANLTWGLNGQPVDASHKTVYRIIAEPGGDLETAESRLELRLERRHFGDSGRLKVRCTASIHSVYWRTTENSAEEERPRAAVMATSNDIDSRHYFHDIEPALPISNRGQDKNKLWQRNSEATKSAEAGSATRNIPDFLHWLFLLYSLSRTLSFGLSSVLDNV
ncbi:hypothetical protein LSTR_LSTR000864 [Laodelphax striatellus]|uniref:Ig-like domain-containing protein n=1 Tax=Laodelphax striatellus TaxID=195883 RepID=A0A482X0V0_LAOST|nr:hypothetical protein LSTR_LSTR000864 [Laodelphax striatellus]